MIETATFTRPLRALLDEAFGVSTAPHGAFLDRGESGLLGTIATIDAATAIRSSAGEPTIAAHCAHVQYLLSLFAEYEQGRFPQPDWPASWQYPAPDAAGWDSLRSDLRAAYAATTGYLDARIAWPEPAVGAWMMLVAHCSYHVGVIHALRRTLAA